MNSLCVLGIYQFNRHIFNDHKSLASYVTDRPNLLNNQAVTNEFSEQVEPIIVDPINVGKTSPCNSPEQLVVNIIPLSDNAPTTSKS